MPCHALGYAWNGVDMREINLSEDYSLVEILNPRINLSLYVVIYHGWQLAEPRLSFEARWKIFLCTVRGG